MYSSIALWSTIDNGQTAFVQHDGESAISGDSLTDGPSVNSAERNPYLVGCDVV